MTDEPIDLDLLMSLDPLSLSDQDLDKIILYQRRQRAQREAGVRTRKPKESAPSKIDISSLLTTPIKNIDRRF